MRIAFINVVMDGDYQYEQEVPLGISSLAAFLRAKGYKAPICQCLGSKGDEELGKAARIEADVYGFQLTMVNYLAVRRAVELIKASRPQALVVCGGPFLATMSEEILANERLIDFLVVGEGEHALLELLETLPDGNLAAIQGLIWRDGQGRVATNAMRKPIEDLDDLPFPARDFLETARRDPVDGGLRESLRVISSRGCVGKCSFCCVNLYAKMLGGKRWRGRSPGHVVDELEYLCRTFDAKLFNYSDSSFEDPGQAGKRRARAICEEIVRRGLKLSAKVYMRCETMKNEADLDLLRLYKRAGIDMIIIGAEAGSDYELALYEKHASLSDNYRTAVMLKDLDLFYVLVGFIMFGPYTTADTLRSNIAFLHNCGFADNIMQLANMLILVRGSKIYHQLKGEGRVIERNYWEQPLYTIIDPVGERMALKWQNMYMHYPATKEVTSLQINIGNVLSRMTNPMNAAILETFRDEYAEFKIQSQALNAKLGSLNHDFFLEALTAIERDVDEASYDRMALDYFSGFYRDYAKQYSDLYEGFLAGIERAGFGMSGLVFRNFFSAVAVNGTERIVGKDQAGARPLEETA